MHTSPAEHDITTRRSPVAIIVRCTCGWSRQFTRHQNALARAARVRAAISEHQRDAARDLGNQETHI